MKVHKLYITNKTGVRGVYWHKRDRVYVATITRGGKRTDLGRFVHLKQAAKRRESVEMEMRGTGEQISYSNLPF